MSGSRVNWPTPSLINGVSQQAPAFRLSSQCEIQDNAISSVLDGVSKRPPTTHMAKISDSPLNNACVHIINRDVQERYVVVAGDESLRVFDMVNGGAEVPVRFPEGKAYLSSSSPRQSFCMITVADYTFIVNRDVTVRMDASEPPEEEVNEAVVYIKKGIVATSYRVMVDNMWVTYVTPEPGSTVISTASGENKTLLIEPWDWSWKQCFQWLQSNNRTIPREFNPNQWTAAEITNWYYGMQKTVFEKNGDNYVQYKVPYDAADVIARLNMSDAVLLEAQAECARHMEYSEDYRNQYYIYQNFLTLKANFRQYARNMSQIMANEGFKTSTTTTYNSDSQPSTEDIAEGLRQSLGGLNLSIEVHRLGSLLRIRKLDGSDFQFYVSDSWGNEAMVGIKREVQKYTDLPARCWDGVRVRVTGENPTREDDYYLEYSSDSFHKNGVWKETRGWNQRNYFDPATMPHTLIREADGTFTFEAGPWKPRKCGDDASVPPPTFVDAKIEDVVFYQQRLGFLVDENIVMSSAGEFFQFWPVSATRVEATDPTDNAVSETDVAFLRHGTVFGDSLVVCADQVQFQLGNGGNGYFSPETARIDPTTRYECSRLCHPVSASQALYFVSEGSAHSGVREYYVASDSVSPDAPEVTTHVPEYLPKNIFKMVVAKNEGMLFLLSLTEPNAIYAYRYYYVGEEKVQSAWFRWLLANDDNILSIAVIQSALHLVVQRPDGVYLETLDLTNPGERDELGYPVLLDRKVRVRGVYDADSDRTTWTIPYPIDPNGFAAVYGPEFPDGMPGGLMSGYAIIGNTLSLPGRFEHEIIAGVNYTMRYRFSRQYFRESREAGASVVYEGRLQLLKLTVAFQDSGYFQVVITAQGRQPVVYQHLGRIGSPDFTTDKPFITSGAFSVPVQAKADRVTIDIVNPLPCPSCFQSAEWVGICDLDARRI